MKNKVVINQTTQTPKHVDFNFVKSNIGIYSIYEYGILNNYIKIITIGSDQMIYICHGVVSGIIPKKNEWGRGMMYSFRPVEEEVVITFDTRK